MDKNKRSIGITILGWLYIIGGFYSISDILTTRSGVKIYETMLYSLPSNYYYVTKVSSIIFTIALILSGIGLLKTLNWARVLAILTEIGRFTYNIVFFIVYIHGYMIPYFNKIGRTGSLIYAMPIFPIAWLIFILYFLNREKTKEQFN